MSVGPDGAGLRDYFAGVEQYDMDTVAVHTVVYAALHLAQSSPILYDSS